MEGMITFTGIIIIVFGILQIILFFKLWKMTNDVAEMKKDLSRNNLLCEANILYIKGDVQAAYNKLMEAFLHDVVEATKLNWTSNPQYDYAQKYLIIRSNYKAAFDKLGLGEPDFTLYKEYDKVKL